MPRRSSTGSEKPVSGRILHLDAFSGIAGNMFVAALLDLGLSRRALDADLAGLDLEFKLRVRRVRRGALAAQHLEVLVPEPKKSKRRGRSAAAGPAHGPEHAHSSGRGHAHGGRAYRDICRVLGRARLEPVVRDRALSIFEALARAEARVHGIAVDDVHFHEVGAVDAIVDVTAAAIGCHRLGITRVTASPIGLGHGHVDTEHGRLPLPGPAALELLKGVPTQPAHVAWETVTPTGAAILRVLVEDYGPLPAMTVEAVGHGAGEDRPGLMPNVLRAILGRSQGLSRDRICCLETNLDDLVPEHFEHLMERLFEAGALDVSLQHLQMKKNRPGFLVRVLARPSERERLARVLFAESTAIGVRCQDWDRLLLEREQKKVETPYGRIRVKLIHGPEGGIDVSAEYEDCKRAALRKGVSLREVVRQAEACAREGLA
jgi:pyridinium-3,5-bisthiocarboxylic acid mononucleotide nickel chelatase